MAQSAGIPRIVRMNMHSFGKVLHPHVQQAHISVGGAPRAAGGTGGGLGAGFRAGSGSASGGRDDAAVSGEFEKNPTLRFLGTPIAGGDLTEKGKADKADYTALRAGTTAYATALQGGATQQEAARAAVSAGGVPFLAAMINHPSSPLANVQAFHNFLAGQGFAGQPRYSQVKGADGQIYNVPVDASGKAGEAEAVPGLPAAQPKLGPTVRTSEGFGRIGPDGNIVPVLDANGQRAQPPLTAAQMKAQAGPQSPVRATTSAQTQELANINTVLENVDKMRNSASASGSLGWGSLNRLAAEHTPLSGSVAQAYNEAYNQMRPALLALTRTPGQQAKVYAQGMLDQLPDPAHANLYNLNQVLPSIQLQMRERLGLLVQNYAPNADNRPGAYVQAVDLAKVYDAHPVKMQDLRAARAMLQQNPAGLTNDQVALLKGEADNNHLAYDDWTRVERQGLQRGMINTTDYSKLVASNPDLGNIPQNEIVQDPALRKQVPLDRTQAPQQAPSLPPQSVETQAPAQAAPPAGVPGVTVSPDSTFASPAQPQDGEQPSGRGTLDQAAPGAGAPAAATTTATPIAPAQQPLVQPNPGQSSGIPPQAGGAQALAPSPIAPSTAPAALPSAGGAAQAADDPSALAAALGGGM